MPAQVGALALVPPLLRVVYSARCRSLMTIVMPVCPFASAATSGTPRAVADAGHAVLVGGPGEQVAEAPRRRPGNRCPGCRRAGPMRSR